MHWLVFLVAGARGSAGLLPSHLSAGDTERRMNTIHCHSILGGRFPRVFGDEFGDKFGDKLSDSLNLVSNVVTNLVMNLVNHHIL